MSKTVQSALTKHRRLWAENLKGCMYSHEKNGKVWTC